MGRQDPGHLEPEWQAIQIELIQEDDGSQAEVEVTISWADQPTPEYMHHFVTGPDLAENCC